MIADWEKERKDAHSRKRKPVRSEKQNQAKPAKYCTECLGSIMFFRDSIHHRRPCKRKGGNNHSGKPSAQAVGDCVAGSLSKRAKIAEQVAIRELKNPDGDKAGGIGQPKGKQILCDIQTQTQPGAIENQRKSPKHHRSIASSNGKQRSHNSHMEYPDKDDRRDQRNQQIHHGEKRKKHWALLSTQPRKAGHRKIL